MQNGQGSDDSFNNTLKKINKQMKGFQRKFDDVESKIEDLKSTINIDQLVSTKLLSTQDMQKERNKSNKKSHHHHSQKDKKKSSSNKRKNANSPTTRQKIENSDPLDEVVTIRKVNPFSTNSFDDQSDIHALQKPAKQSSEITVRKSQTNTNKENINNNNSKQKENTSNTNTNTANKNVNEDKTQKPKEVKLDDDFVLTDSFSEEKHSDHSNGYKNNAPPPIEVKQNKPKETNNNSKQKQANEEKTKQNDTKKQEPFVVSTYKPPPKEDEKPASQREIKQDSSGLGNEFELSSPSFDDTHKDTFASDKKKETKQKKEESPPKDTYTSEDNIDFEEFHNTPAQVLRHSSSLLDIKPQNDPPPSHLTQGHGDEFIFRSEDDPNDYNKYGKKNNTNNANQQDDYDDFVYEEDDNNDYYYHNGQAGNYGGHYNSEFDDPQYDDDQHYNSVDDHYDHYNNDSQEHFPPGFNVDDAYDDSMGYEGNVTTTKSQQPRYNQQHQNQYNDDYDYPFEEEDDYYDYYQPPAPLKYKSYGQQQQTNKQEPGSPNKKNVSLSPKNMANNISMSMATVSGDSQEFHDPYQSDEDNNIRTVNLEEEYIPPPSSFKNKNAAKVERLNTSEEASLGTPSSPEPRMNTTSWKPQTKKYGTPPHSDEYIEDSNDFPDDEFPDDFGDVPQLPDFPETPVQKKKRLLA